MYVLGRHEGGLNTNCLAYSPDSRLLASGRDLVQLWDLWQRRRVQEIRIAGNVSSVGFAPDGRLVVAAGGGAAVQLFDVETGRLVQHHDYSWCRAQCALVSPDGKTLLCGGHAHGPAGAKIGRVLRWNLATGRHRRALEGPQEDVGFTALSPNGRRLAAGGDQGTAWLWDLRTRKMLATFKCRSGWRVVAFTPDGRTLAITAGRNIELWDPQTLQRRHILRGHTGMVYALAVTPAGGLVSGGGDGAVRLWDPATLKQLACLDWQIGRINNVAVAPDGLTAAAASNRGDIVVWDLE
jgi:WD40 repeat protein